MTLSSNVELYLWGQNRINTFVDQSVYLYAYDPGTGNYTLLSSAYIMAQERHDLDRGHYVLLAGPTARVVPASSQLVLWSHAGGNKSHSMPTIRSELPQPHSFDGEW